MITVTKSMKEHLKKVLLANSFIYSVPLILVFRNTRLDADILRSEYIEDNGHNSCDSILLIDEELAYVLTGRSYPHERYQQEQIAGTGAANYIATGYYRRAWRKGLHRGYRALVQNVKFVVWRSKDAEFMNEDDYNETRIVADNFHGFSPFSAGCVTVKGNMNPPTEDWSIADRWIYSKKDAYFDACILNYGDLKTEPRLRIGSYGRLIEELQSALKIETDGDFGPYTHEIVRKFQRDNNLKDDGIVGPETACILKINLKEREAA